ncbi:hypothetical protein [Muricoccus aerilatus]|uniref:hypothetical protein n=1 Tax=Muricoccus aerilatus TaxID=452982 RepID=UPI0005C19446|nr:hypothetical protein [Roseomonas aerilata]
MPAHQIPAAEARAQTRALDSLAEIANDNLPEPLRHEVAARVLLAARQVSGLFAGAVRPRGADSRAEQVVESIAAGWDPRAVTALEFVETLPVRTLDGLLGHAPRWARAMRALIAPQPGSAAA